MMISEKTMNEKLISFNINGEDINVIMSDHANRRLIQRIKNQGKNITKYAISGLVLMLGEKLIDLCNKDVDISITDRNHGFTAIAKCEITNGVKEVTIITVINKVNCYVKEGTIKML